MAQYLLSTIVRVEWELLGWVPDFRRASRNFKGQGKRIGGVQLLRLPGGHLGMLEREALNSGTCSGATESAGRSGGWLLECGMSA